MMIDKKQIGEEDAMDHRRHTLILVFILIGITVLWKTTIIQNGKTKRVRIEKGIKDD